MIDCLRKYLYIELLHMHVRTCAFIIFPPPPFPPPSRVAGKFGGELNLAVYSNNRQIKIRQYFLLAYIHNYGDPVLNRQIYICQCVYNGDLGPNRQI